MKLCLSGSAISIVVSDEHPSYVSRGRSRAVGSPTAEKLQAITEIDLDDLLAVDNGLEIPIQAQQPMWQTPEFRTRFTLDPTRARP